MTAEQKTAFIQAQTARMLVQMEMMKAANVQRQDMGHGIAYGEDSFDALLDQYECLSNNALITFFNEP